MLSQNESMNKDFNIVFLSLTSIMSVMFILAKTEYYFLLFFFTKHTAALCEETTGTDLMHHSEMAAKNFLRTI